MALDSALGSRCNALRRKIKALARSIRTSMAPIPPHEHEVTGQRVTLSVSKSLERHVQQLKYGAWSSIRCLASSVADTAGSLACCVKPPAVTEEWEDDLGLLYSDKDYASAYVSRADFMAGSSKKPLLHVILLPSYDEAFVDRSEVDAECTVADCDSVLKEMIAGTHC